MRVISLVPSLTHMVCDLGLREQLVGCTNFCVEPPGLSRKVALVGGTKDPDLRQIAALKPTHILVNTEENTPEVIAACRELGSTFISFPKSPTEVPGMLREVSAWLGVDGEKVALSVEFALKSLKSAVRKAKAKERRFLYFIWREPYMVAAGDTYISATLELLGWRNAAADGARYPAMTLADLQEAKADLWLLSSEPYPFRRRDALRLRKEYPDAPEMLWADGQLMSWYGTKTEEALRAALLAATGAPTNLFKAIEVPSKQAKLTGLL